MRAVAIRLSNLHQRFAVSIVLRKASVCCSQSLGSVELKDGLPVVISASFATPPPEMTEIQVQIPNFGVFPHVPIG